MTVQAETAGRGSSWPQVSGLLRKDLFVFVPRDRFVVGLVYLLGHPMVLPSQEAFFWLGVFLAAALVVYVPTMEWHQESERMLSSLPVRRSTLVFARYLSSILACGVAAVAWVCTGHLLSPILSPLLLGAEPMSQMWTTLEGILAFLTVTGSLTALFLPLYFRFGLGRGAILFVGLFLAFYACLAFRAGPILPGRGLEGVLSEWVSSIGPGWVLLLVLGGLGSLLATSGRLSVRVLRRRDL